MAENTFSPDHVHDFLKALVTIGGIRYIDENHCVRNKSDDSLVAVKINNGRDCNRAIALYKENMPISNDVVILNPFTENIGRAPEKEWFYGFLSVVPGCLIHNVMEATANLAVSKEKDAGFATAATLQPFMDRIDKKFVDELDKVKPTQIGFIYYDNSSHTAQLVSGLWEEQFENDMKGKIRKSSLLLVRDMVAALLNVTQPEEIVYTATLIGCPKFDAFAHVLANVIERIYPTYNKLLVDDKLPGEEIVEHMKHFEAYQKAMQWLSSVSTSAAAKPEKKSVSDVLSAPWTGASSGMAALGGTASPTLATARPVAPATTVPGGSIDFSKARIAGTTPNPNFMGTMGGGMRVPYGAPGYPTMPMNPGMQMMAPMGMGYNPMMPMGTPNIFGC